MTLPLQIPETIPSNWSWRNLVELCNPKQWKTISNSDLTETGYRVFGANGFIGYYHEFNHEDETISVTCRGATCGTVNLVPPRTYITGNSMCLDNLSREVSKFYLFYATQFRTFSDVISGSAQPQITGEGLKKVSLPLPPLPEQKEIASILTSVDEVIENTQKQIDKLQDLKKATMNELLTKGIGHTEFKDSELGRIPKSWEVATLESVSSFRRGSFPQPYGNPEWYDDKGFPFVQVFDIAFNRRLKTSTKAKISKKAADMSVFIPAGSLLVSLQGSIGRVAVTQYDAYVDRTVLIFSKYESSLERFFFSIIIEELFRRQKEVADGGIIKTITKETLRSFEITVPPLSEQRKIGVTIQSIEGSISKHERKLTQTQSLKKSLMQDLLTGKVRVQS